MHSHTLLLSFPPRWFANSIVLYGSVDVSLRNWNKYCILLCRTRPVKKKCIWIIQNVETHTKCRLVCVHGFTWRSIRKITFPMTCKWFWQAENLKATLFVQSRVDIRINSRFNESQRNSSDQSNSFNYFSVVIYRIEFSQSPANLYELHRHTRSSDSPTLWNVCALCCIVSHSIYLITVEYYCYVLAGHKGKRKTKTKIHTESLGW